ncbi:hypothetical protein [Gloeothece verrucosa]|uniref:hypothetical protein n=1 Tax=Gloeothece verrucosa TaxID=2546359 RepID=UPI00017E240C|nr:hypothetical protein [Gloeothece verrucosa]
MAIDAVEGEQKLTYSASRQEHLSRLLKMEGALRNIKNNEQSSLPDSTSKIPSPETTLTTSPDAPQTNSSSTQKKSRKRTPTASSTSSVDKGNTTVASSAPTVKKGRKKATSVKNDEIIPPPCNNETRGEESVKVEDLDTIDATSTQKKTKRRVGARKPKRDHVGSEPEKA